jgi:hypothetical protein
LLEIPFSLGFLRISSRALDACEVSFSSHKGMQDQNTQCFTGVPFFAI